MSPEPYRTPSCPTCSAPHVEQAHVCQLCKEPFLPGSASAEVCDPCLRKACRVVARAAEKSAPSRARSLLHWLPSMAALGFCGLIAFGFIDATSRLTQLRTASLQHAEHNARAKDKPHPKKRRNAPKKDAAPPAPPPPQKDATLDDASVPALTSVLAALQPEAHDPDALLARVHKLREAGLDIFLVRTNVGRSILDSGADLRTRISPVLRNGKTVGVRFSHVGSDTMDGLAGIQPGDVLVSINGYGVDSPDGALSGYAASRQKHAAVFELFRNGRRVVLDVRWPK